jgi:hypothetical protein
MRLSTAELHISRYKWEDVSKHVGIHWEDYQVQENDIYVKKRAGSNG